MSKYIVLHGKNFTPGTAGTSYTIFDVVKFDPKKDLTTQMRKYSFRKFFESGKSAWRLKREVFCRRRHIVLHNGKIFAEGIKIFEHELTNEYYGFVPIECFGD